MEECDSRPFMSEYDPSLDFLSELLVVIGECDLLHEELTEYRYSKRLRIIREAAVRMSQRVAEQHFVAARYAN